jgi:hypothetical protein
MTATISTGNPDKDSSEFFAIVDLKLVLDNGILDENHPVLVTNINNSVKESYPKGACPDCGTDIPHDAPEGWNCPNCNHACYSD